MRFTEASFSESIVEEEEDVDSFEHFCEEEFHKDYEYANQYSTSRLIKFLPDNPDEICDRLKALKKQKGAGNDTNSFDDEIVAVTDKS